MTPFQRFACFDGGADSFPHPQPPQVVSFPVVFERDHRCQAWMVKTTMVAATIARVTHPCQFAVIEAVSAMMGNIFMCRLR